MTLSDLMEAHANRDLYSQFPNWTMAKDPAAAPYCFHSDWINGLYLNYYFVANHITQFTQNDFFLKRPTYRTGWNLGMIYRKHEGVCRNNGIENCQAGSNITICHYVNDEEMKQLYQQSMSQ